MKIKGLLLAIVASFILFACDDEPTPFEKPETSMFFNGFVNNYEKSIVEGQNGYRYVTTDSCATIDLGVTWYATSLIYQGNSNYYMSNRECFGLNYYNLFDTVLTNRDSVVNKYFSGSMQFAYLDTTLAVPDEFMYGVEVIWIDGKGDTYTSLYTRQSNPMSFNPVSISFGASGRTVRVEGTFSCNLYSLREKKTASLTNGSARISIITSCF